MAAPIVTRAQLENAALDALSLQQFINNLSGTVTTRLGATYKCIPQFLTDLNTNVEASYSSVANKYAFDTVISPTVPGVVAAGGIRANNATLSSATNLYIAAQSGEVGNPDISNFIATWGDSTSSDKGYIRINKIGSPTTFMIFKITGAVTDNTTYLTVPVSYITGSGSLAASDGLFLGFTKIGDKGANGAGSGDVISIETSTTDGQAVVFNGTTGKSVKKVTASGYPKLASGIPAYSPTIPVADIAAVAANTVLANATASSAAANALAINSSSLVGRAASGNITNIGVASGVKFNSSNLELDVNGLTTLSGAIDYANDYIPIYDASAAANRKVLIPAAAMDLITSYTISGTPSVVDFTGLSSTYNNYLLEFYNVDGTTSASLLWARYSSDNGVSFYAGSEYNYLGYGSNLSSTALTAFSASGNNKFLLANVGTGFGNRWNGSILFKNLSVANSHKVMKSFVHYSRNGATELYQAEVVGSAVSSTALYTSAMNAIRIMVDSSTFTAGGVFKLYGIKS